MRIRIIVAAAGTACVTLPAAAESQDYGPMVVAAVDAICSNDDEVRTRSPAQLAEALLTEAGVLPSQIIRATAAPGAPAVIRADELPAASLSILLQPSRLGDDKTANRLRALASTSNALLLSSTNPLAKKISVSAVPNGGSIFATAGASLTCAAAKPTQTPSPARTAADYEKSPPSIVVRGKLDDFPLGVREATSSFQASYARDRSTDLSGDRTVTKTFVMRGAAGFRLAGNEVDSHIFAYGDYALNQVRKSTSPTPTPAAGDGRAKDIDALELGVFGSTRFYDDSIRLSGRAGVIFDFKSDARRIVSGLRASFVGDNTFGPRAFPLCNFGLYSGSVLGLPIEGRCFAAIRIDASEILERGTASFGPESSIVAAGGEFGFEFRPKAKMQVDGSLKTPDGIVGSLTYRFQPMIAGTVNDIDRLDASVRYRWWADQVAFDFGLTYADGTEVKSFADENRLLFSFGILF